MKSNNFTGGQPLGAIVIRVPTDITWGPNSEVLSRSSVHSGFYGVRLEAVKWTGSGSIVVKDAQGIELFSGATASEPVRIHSTLPHLTVAAPLQITVAAGTSGSIVFYGIVL
jgi:hypothetical protein